MAGPLAPNWREELVGAVSESSQPIGRQSVRVIVEAAKSQVG